MPRNPQRLNLFTRLFALGFAAIGSLLATAPVQALNIVFAGAVANNAGNQVTQFYTQTTPKAYDADGDNRYGSAGYDLFGLNTSQPGYNQFVSIGPSIAVVGPFAGYATIDNPGFADAQVRTTTAGTGGAGSKAAVITYQINNAASIPNGFRIGIMTDGLDSAGWGSQGVFVEQTAGTGGGSAFVNVNPIRNSTIDMLFFDITDAKDGDRYTISVNKAPNNGATLQGVVFDTRATALPARSILLNVGPLGGLAGDGGLSQTVQSDLLVWNNFGQIAGGVAFGGVQYSNGTEANGVTVRADGVAGRDGNTTLNAGWGDAQGVPQDVMNSWYFRGNGTMTMTIAGLDPNKLYDVELFNAFNNLPNLSDMKIDGLFADGTFGPSAGAAGDDWNRATNGFAAKSGLFFNKLSTGADGTFVITFTGLNPTLQAIRLSEFTIPEPATMSLLALAGAAMLRRRRRA